MTVMVIPEAGRQMVRMQLKHAWVWIGGGIATAAALVSVSLAAVGVTEAGESTLLKRALARHAEQYASEVTLRDAVIEQLQDELLTLSEQAKAVQSRLNELEQLEQEMKSLAADGNGQFVESRTTASAITEQGRIAAGQQPTASGSGGDWVQPSSGQVLDRVEAAADELYKADARIGELGTRLANVRDRIAAVRDKQRRTPSIWPADGRRVTSGYGARKDPFHRRPAFHGGLDIAGDVGSPVYAAADGRVEEAGYDRAKGNYVRVDHGDGVHTLYLHLSRIDTARNDAVRKGQTIGGIGSTGRSTGPHLHYEIQANGRPVDPLAYLPEATAQVHNK